jgi:hypothetical protein
MIVIRRRRNSLKLSLRLAITAALVVTILAVFLLNGHTSTEEYEGTFQDGQPHGFGIWKHPNGAYYAGEFHEGSWQGRGTWIHPTGIKYAGEWLDGEYHGRGALFLPGGSHYIGEWLHGKKDGPGIYCWADNRSYSGWWSEDRPWGYGIMDNPGQYIYRGDWIDGHRSGKGRALYPDGSEYFGSWLNDKRHGEGLMLYSDGTIYEGSWSGDREHGEGTLTYPDGSARTAFWINGSLQDIPVEAIDIAPRSLTLSAGGETAALIARISPEDAANQIITWASSAPDVASVSDGIVNPHSSGNALITATTADGKFTAICSVTVSGSATSITGVTLDRSSVTLRAGESTTLIAFITPNNATNPGVSWASGDSEVVSVTGESRNRGAIIALTPGEAWITATTLDGRYTSRCQVTVLPRQDSVSRAVVPRLTGKTLDEAGQLIVDAGLNLGFVTYEFHNSLLSGRVITQSPAVGSLVASGSLINLVISKGPDPEPLPEPENGLNGG